MFTQGQIFLLAVFEGSFWRSRMCMNHDYEHSVWLVIDLSKLPGNMNKTREWWCLRLPLICVWFIVWQFGTSEQQDQHITSACCLAQSEIWREKDANTQTSIFSCQTIDQKGCRWFFTTIKKQPKPFNTDNNSPWE